MPNVGNKETHDEFINRCMSELVGKEGKDKDQAYAICQFKWTEAKMNAIHELMGKVSLDYDGVLSTDKGKELAKRLISEGNTVYVISARGDKQSMLNTAKELGIPESRVFATGSNKAKVEKVKSLGSSHYDNNPDVIKEIGKGHLFK